MNFDPNLQGIQLPTHVETTKKMLDLNLQK